MCIYSNKVSAKNGIKCIIELGPQFALNIQRKYGVQQTFVKPLNGDTDLKVADIKIHNEAVTAFAI